MTTSSIDGNRPLDNSKSTSTVAKWHKQQTEKRATKVKYRPMLHLCRRALSLVNSEHLEILKDPNDHSLRRRSLVQQAIKLTRVNVFRDSDGKVLPTGYDKWTTPQLGYLYNLLIEFVTHYKKRATNDDIKPTTLRGYISGLQRAFLAEWGYDISLLRGVVFGNAATGLVTVVDNKIRREKAFGLCPESHNVLNKQDIVKLYSSEALSKETPKGFVTRMIFNLAIRTTFRPTELANLRVQDVSRVQFGQEDAWRIVSHIGCMDGSSKTRGGGMKFAKVKPKEMFVWHKEQLDGRINIYKDIEEYVALAATCRNKAERFFLAVNYYAGQNKNKFLKDVNLGKNSSLQYIQGACDAVDIVGTGVRKKMTMEGLRRTAITQLFEAGHVYPLLH